MPELSGQMTHDAQVSPRSEMTRVVASTPLRYNRPTPKSDCLMKLEPDTYPLLSVDPWFSKLPKDLQHKLLSMGVQKHLPAGQAIVRRGQPNSGLFCLLEGVVLVVVTVKIVWRGTFTSDPRVATIGAWPSISTRTSPSTTARMPGCAAPIGTTRVRSS